ncbi:hypothetical protein FRB94_007711 [Tulasnella sp. JGI-2019a]|nr:hypothetical protein FRB94_007711 [Tulasnella sp. JGI-2019a]
MLTKCIVKDGERATAQQRAQQQLFMVQQLAMSDQERRDAAIDLLINMLGTGDTGAAKKPPCLAGTREHVLGKILEWIDDTWRDSKRCLDRPEPGSRRSRPASRNGR